LHSFKIQDGGGRHLEIHKQVYLDQFLADLQGLRGIQVLPEAQSSSR